MANDVFKSVLFSDGEGVTHTDLSNISKYSQARLMDMFWLHMAGGLSTGAKQEPTLWGGINYVARDRLAYTLTGGECVIKQGSTAVKVTITPGTIIQLTDATPDGNEPKMLAYDVVSTDGIVADGIDFTISAGATNPRIDILQVKLEWEDGNSETRDFEDATTRAKSTQSMNTHRRVKATFSIKQGATGATPAYPLPDAGYVAIAAIRVGQTWTTGITRSGIEGTSSTACIRQLTIPLRMRAVTVTSDQFDYGFATSWARNGTTRLATASATTATNLVCWAPDGVGTSRIVGIRINGLIAAGGTPAVRLGTYQADTTSGYTFNSGSLALTSVFSYTTAEFDAIAQIKDISAASADTAVSTSSGWGAYGDPYWTSRAKAGPAARDVNTNLNADGANYFSRAAIQIDAASTSKIISVTWYLAG